MFTVKVDRNNWRTSWFSWNISGSHWCHCFQTYMLPLDHGHMCCRPRAGSLVPTRTMASHVTAFLRWEDSRFTVLQLHGLHSKMPCSVRRLTLKDERLLIASNTLCIRIRMLDLIVIYLLMIVIEYHTTFCDAIHAQQRIRAPLENPEKSQTSDRIP